MTEPLSPDTGDSPDPGTRNGPDAGAGPGPDVQAGPGAPASDDARGTRNGDEAASVPGAPLPPLPDLSEIDLETLRTLDHPVLAEMVGELRERAERPREMLWGFTNAF